MLRSDLAAALRAISAQITEVERRLDSLEMHLCACPLSLGSDTSSDASSDMSDSSSEGYQSAPATFN